MQTIEISKDFKIGLDDLVQSVVRLDATDFNIFLNKLNSLAVEKSQMKSSEQEAQLIKEIKNIVPTAIVKRYKVLQNKHFDEKITQKEHSELLMLIDFIEEKSAERVILLGQLAQLKNTTARVLVHQLKLKDIHGKATKLTPQYLWLF